MTNVWSPAGGEPESCGDCVPSRMTACPRTTRTVHCAAAHPAQTTAAAGLRAAACEHCAFLSIVSINLWHSIFICLGTACLASQPKQGLKSACWTYLRTDVPHRRNVNCCQSQLQINCTQKAAEIKMFVEQFQNGAKTGRVFVYTISGTKLWHGSRNSENDCRHTLHPAQHEGCTSRCPFRSPSLKT